MHKSQSLVAGVLEAELDALCRRHGVWNIVRALVAATIRRPRSWDENRVSDLNGYMRRDIGVPDVIDLDQQRFQQLRRLL